MSHENSVDGLNPAPGNSIVVGHDGSDGADYALATALGLADQLQVAVVIVRAWSLAAAPRPPDWEFGYVSSFDEYAAAVYGELVRDVHTRVDRYSTLSVSYRVVHSSAAKSLIDISRDARMLVVGLRGHGGLVGMLLGSVSDQCVRHADCPVLVVRPRS
ncbi:universal stress protein [Pseudarthrobacter sp. HLT3-5]|uniref:universal stress protein n=1 Tax=Pseudarthrobacter cellobiosi TaxID=2953654 RepID=UPI00208E4416|nr:universal stress protein [Pseudarthrobacter sp. HLT3-5]MCO4275997.1 universal stress protein [Pseudarthrobacter sp. HLT3-5]